MRNTSLINSLIQKEYEVIKSYEGIISRAADDEMVSTANERIKRHNNHIEALKGIQGR